LHKGKPFFSYSVVFNVFPNKLWYSRFAIVIWGKSVSTNVVRNKYRRLFYNISTPYVHKTYGDVVCVVKKQTKLDSLPETFQKVQSEINYLFEKKLWKNT